jgi:hypothetical protein
MSENRKNEFVPPRKRKVALARRIEDLWDEHTLSPRFFISEAVSFSGENGLWLWRQTMPSGVNLTFTCSCDTRAMLQPCGFCAR